MIKGVPSAADLGILGYFGVPWEVQKLQKNDTKMEEQKWRHGARKSGA